LRSVGKGQPKRRLSFSYTKEFLSAAPSLVAKGRKLKKSSPKEKDRLHKKHFDILEYKIFIDLRSEDI